MRAVCYGPDTFPPPPESALDAAEQNVTPLRLPLRPAALADIGLQPASLDIWDSKYRLKTKEGEALDLDLDHTYRRVARTLADVEITREARDHWYERFLTALRRGAIPAGRIVSNAGAREHKPATSTINCTVSGVIEDSMNDILRKVHEAGLTLKAGCGIGYEFSTLRPRGAWVSGAGARTSGPLSFMDIYDRMCFTVSSAGGRRGAQMGTFDVSHPDVMEFIRAKREDGRLRQFNLSLLITREFMDAVRRDRPWKLAFPLSRSEREQFDLDDPEQVVWRRWPVRFDSYTVDEQGRVACRVYRTLPARRMWDAIMSSTYDFAEPGFVLIDEINEMNNNWFCEEIRATNPCGEQPLPPYGSCLLGSINLTGFVEMPFSARTPASIGSASARRWRRSPGCSTTWWRSTGCPSRRSAWRSRPSAATAWGSWGSAPRSRSSGSGTGGRSRWNSPGRSAGNWPSPAGRRPSTSRRRRGRPRSWKRSSRSPPPCSPPARRWRATATRPATA